LGLLVAVFEATEGGSSMKDVALSEIEAKLRITYEQAEGSRTRAAWLDRAESEGLTLATAHVPPSPIGRIVREGGQRLLRRR
jgi:hypothetical protein